MSRWRLGLLSLGGAALVRVLFATTRVERVHVERLHRLRREGRPVLFAFWHGHMLPLVHCHQREGIVVLVSEHADGELIARILRHFGFASARGSSTRGGARGLRALVRAAREGKDTAVTPDGPRGPRHEVKSGAMVAARLAGVPIVPLRVSATRSWELGSWDRFLVPKPFSTVRVEYLVPRAIPPDASKEDLARFAAELGVALREGDS